MEKTGSFLSRRRLLVGLGIAGTATAALLALPFRAVIALTARDLVRSQPILRRMLLSLADANYDEWRDQIGTTFIVVGGNQMKLVAVSPLASTGTRPLRATRDSAFVAKFDVQNGGTMAGDLIYNVMHPSYGGFAIFLSASTDPRLPHRMNALFN